MASATRERLEERLVRGGAAVELLWVPALGFALASEVRRRAYDLGLLPRRRLDLPVVCAGNLTAGGTGKSPAVLWLARWFLARGWRPGLLARGYGRGEAAGDEAAEFAARLPEVPRVLDADRVRGARALERQGVDVVLLDDGFQHRRLARDLDLVLVDTTRPWGLPPGPDGRALCAPLPRGLMRESARALGRAQAILLTRVDQVPAATLVGLEGELERIAPGIPRVRTRHAARVLVDLEGGEHDPARLAGREVDLASGIGNPQAFERSVQSLGAKVVEHRRLPDHHAWTAADLAGLGRGRPLVTTAKDAVKWVALGAAVPPGAFALRVELEVLDGLAPLEALLESLAPGARRRARAALHEGLHG